MTGWKHVALGDLFRLKHGFAFKSEYYRTSGDQILLTPGNFKAAGGLKSRGEKEKYYEGPVPDGFVLRQHDLLVVMTDLTQDAPILGSAAFVPESQRFLHNQRLGKVTELCDEVDVRFAYYLLNSPSVRAQIRSTASGSTVRHTSPDRIYAVEAALPPIGEQLRIAATLAAYDELIENNLRRIEILEEMAQAVYREWFVNFRFLGHEDVAFVESPFGPIPALWEPATVGDAIDLNPRVRIADGVEVRFVPMASLVEGSMVIEGHQTRIGPSGSQFSNGDTLLARITPSLENGKTAFVQFLSEGEVACGSTEFIVMRSRTLTPEFVYLLARTSDFRGVAIKSMVGASGRQRVQGASIANYSFPHPDSSTLQRFRELTTPLFGMVQNLVDQNANLRVTRDLLLPRLVSGEIGMSALDIETEWLAS